MPQHDLFLLKADAVFAPAPLGAQTLLIGAGRILDMAPGLEDRYRDTGIPLETAPGGTLIPGLIDQHIHFLGGGEGDGPNARMPEVRAEEIFAGGVTTAASLLGTDDNAKSLPQLLRKANELEEAGLTTFIYTGSMALPGPTITGSIAGDVLLVDKVIGAKTAIAERAYPNLDPAGFAALAGELVRARAMSGKPGILHMHVGRLASGLTQLLDLIERIDFPLGQAVPTHINRNPEVSPVFAQGIDYARRGGIIDFTCCLGPRYNLPGGLDIDVAVARALDAGVTIENITLSSDACVAIPAGPGASGHAYVRPDILFSETINLVKRGVLDLENALKPVTTNIARLLGLSSRKGLIGIGADADLVALDGDLGIAGVFARGRRVVG